MHIRKLTGYGVCAALILVLRPAAAAALLTYGVIKGQEFTVVSTAFGVFTAPTGGTLSAWALGAQEGDITGASLHMPAGDIIQNMEVTGARATLADNAASTSTFESKYPAGQYTLAVRTAAGASLSLPIVLPASQYPPTPQILNLSDLWTLDASRDQWVAWTPLPDFVPGGMVRVSVANLKGVELYSTPGPGEAGALAGTASSALLPASIWTGPNTTNIFYLKVVYYSLVSTNTASLPGTAGLAGFSRSLRAVITPQMAPLGITNYGVAIGQLARQENFAVPKLMDTQPFQAMFWAYGAVFSNQIQNATWLKPDRVDSVPLPRDGNDQFQLAQGFADTATLEAACPPGKYTLASQLVANCATEAAVALGAAVFPPLPQALVSADLQAADAAQPLEIHWARWAGGVAGDSIHLAIRDRLGRVVLATSGWGAPDALGPEATMVTIPTNTFVPGEVYTCEIGFFHWTTRQTGDLPGATGLAGAYSQTQFTFPAAGEWPVAMKQLAIASPTNLPSLTVAAASTLRVYALNARQPLAWILVSGSLPPGLALVADTGELAGYPSAAGTYPVRLRLACADGQTADSDFILTVQGEVAPLALAGGALPDAAGGQYYSAPLDLSGGVPPYTWQLKDGASLPSGLALDLTQGLLAGLPEQSGAFTFAAQVTDALGKTAEQTWSLSVPPWTDYSYVRITSLSRLPGGQVQLQASGPLGVAYTIESSGDLKTWTPLLTTDDLIQNPVQFALPSSPGPVFLRVRAGEALPELPPWNVTAILDPACSVATCVGPGGGTLALTNAIGEIYLLAIPANALSEATLIRMTAIVGLTGETGASAAPGGVRLEPEGLLLQVPATLTIDAPTAFATTLVPHAGQGLGMDYHAIPAQVSQGHAVIPVPHFSVYRYDAALNAPYGYCSEANRAMARLAAYARLPWNQRTFGGYVKIYEDWAKGIIARQIRPARQDELRLPMAIEEVFAFLVVSLNYADDEVSDLFGKGHPQINDIDVIKKDLHEVREELKQAIMNGTGVVRDRCLRTQDPVQGLKILWLRELADRANKLNCLNEALDPHYFDKPIRQCLRFEYSLQCTVKDTFKRPNGDDSDPSPHIDNIIESFSTPENGALQFVEDNTWKEIYAPGVHPVHAWDDKITWPHEAPAVKDDPTQVIDFKAVFNYTPNEPGEIPCDYSDFSVGQISISTTFACLAGFTLTDPASGITSADWVNGLVIDSFRDAIFLNLAAKPPYDVYERFAKEWKVLGGKKFATLFAKRDKEVSSKETIGAEINVQIDYAPRR